MAVQNEKNVLIRDHEKAMEDKEQEINEQNKANAAAIRARSPGPHYGLSLGGSAGAGASSAGVMPGSGSLFRSAST